MGLNIVLSLKMALRSLHTWASKFFVFLAEFHAHATLFLA